MYTFVLCVFVLVTSYSLIDSCDEPMVKNMGKIYQYQIVARAMCIILVCNVTVTYLHPLSNTIGDTKIHRYLCNQEDVLSLFGIYCNIFQEIFTLRTIYPYYIRFIRSVSFLYLQDHPKWLNLLMLSWTAVILVKYECESMYLSDILFTL